MDLTLTERIQIVKWYYSGNSKRAIVKLYILAFENRPSTTLRVIDRIIRNFETRGCVTPLDHKKPVRPHDDARCSRKENSRQSINKIAAANNTDATKTARKILRKNNDYRPSKVTKTSENDANDLVNKATSCENAHAPIHADPAHPNETCYPNKLTVTEREICVKEEVVVKVEQNATDMENWFTANAAIPDGCDLHHYLYIKSENLT